MKLIIYISIVVLILIALAQIGSAITILLLGIFSIGVMTLLAGSIMEINKPLKKPRS